MDVGEDPADVTATEVLNNIEAMRWAVDSLSTLSPASGSVTCLET